jgi:thiosulfate/3-mercaptopyruvate sulfurtransferase
MGGANAAARAWWLLRAVGHRSVEVLDGGLDAAERAGLSFESGETRVEARPPYPVPSEWTLPTADIDEVARVARDPAWRVIDVRAAERYRGEVEPLDPVAGHIPGALNVPLTESLSEEGSFRSIDALASHFRSRLSDTPMERVIVSCGSGVTACHTLLALEHAGLSGAALYVGSWSEWCRSGRERAP